jgi:hypothetical protein
MPYPSDETVAKEFGKRFIPFFQDPPYEGMPHFVESEAGDILRYIFNLRATDRAAIIEKVEGMKKEELPVGQGHTLYGWNLALDSLLTELKGL